MHTVRIADDDVTRLMVQQLLEVGAKFSYEFDRGMNVITADRSQRYMDDLTISASKLDAAARGTA